MPQRDEAGYDEELGIESYVLHVSDSPPSRFVSTLVKTIEVALLTHYR
jgi:hypothetical protein